MRDTNVIEPDAMTSLETGHDAHAHGQRGAAVDAFLATSDDFVDGEIRSGKRVLENELEVRIAQDAVKSSTLPLIDSAEALDPILVPPTIAEDDDIVNRSRGSLAAFFFVFDQCIVSATSFLTTVAVGRSGSREELGRYFLAFSILLFARNWQVQLVTDPYKVFWSRQPRSSRGSYLGSTAVQNSVFTALMMLGLLIYGVFQRFDGGLHEMLPVTLVLLVGLPFLLFREFIRNVALAHLRAIPAIAIDSTVAVLQLGLLVLMAKLHRLTSESAYLVMGGASLVACVGWLGMRKQPMQFVGSQMRPDFHKNWAFGKWALANHLLGELLTYLGPWLVAYAWGESETGMLAAATTLIGLSYPFVSGLGNYLGPRAAIDYSEKRYDALLSLLIRYGLVFGVTLGLFCLGMVFFGNSLTVLVYGNRYHGIGMIVTIMAVTALIKSLRMTAGIGLWAIEQPWANPVAETCTIVVSIGTLLCIGHLGLLGFVISMLCGSIAGMVVAIFAMARLMKPLLSPASAAGLGEAP
jgi:O-antigen/teichoic acid export membrane protein